jgi:hypothetical protein
MEVIVSTFAVVVALGCMIAIFMASRKDKKKQARVRIDCTRTLFEE